MRISETECAEFPCIRVRCIPPCFPLPHRTRSRAHPWRAPLPHPSNPHRAHSRSLTCSRAHVPGEWRDSRTVRDRQRACVPTGRTRTFPHSRTAPPFRALPCVLTCSRSPLLTCAHVCSFVQVTPPAFTFLPHQTIHPTIGHSYTHRAL